MERVRERTPTSLSDQALSLLDLYPSLPSHEIFTSLEPLITGSLQNNPTAKEITQETPVSYTVAQRLHRAQYEDQARADALITALQKLRERKHGGRLPS